jgi:hypothetical protein
VLDRATLGAYLLQIFRPTTPHRVLAIRDFLEKSAILVIFPEKTKVPFLTPKSRFSRIRRELGDVAYATQNSIPGPKNGQLTPLGGFCHFLEIFENFDFLTQIPPHGFQKWGFQKRACRGHF